MSRFELYRHWDAEGRLLYVGLTRCGPDRQNAHRKGARWWGDVTSITIERFSTFDDLAAAETLAIKTELPLHNVAQSPTPHSLMLPCHRQLLDFSATALADLTVPSHALTAEYVDASFPALSYWVGTGRVRSRRWRLLYRVPLADRPGFLGPLCKTTARGGRDDKSWAEAKEWALDQLSVYEDHAAWYGEDAEYDFDYPWWQRDAIADDGCDYRPPELEKRMQLDCLPA